MCDRLLGLPTADIVSGIRAGDKYLYEALFTAYWGPLCRVAFAMIQNQADAEDLVARVLVSIWERRATWEVQGNLEGYLSHAIRNQVRKLWRDMGRHDRLLQRYVSPGESPGMGESIPDERETSVRTELLLTADVAIESLPDRYRTALRYRWYEQLGYDEIGRIMKVSPGAARILVSRAITQLRRFLRE